MYRVLALSTLVLLACGFVSPAWSHDLPYHGNGHLMINHDDLEWGPIGSMAPGAKIAVIEGDLGDKGQFTFRLKLPPDYRIDPHVHPAYERVTVISGELYFGHGETFDRNDVERLGPGGLAFMAPGEPMYGYTTDRETVIQLHGTGPWGIEYANPEDDPRQ